MKSNINYSEITNYLNQIQNVDKEFDIKFETQMIMYRFLSEVEKICEQKNLSRKDLAKMLDTSPSYITQLYRGHKIVNLNLIAKIQHLFDITFEIKANSNNVSSEYSETNFDDIFNMQSAAKGMWCFHPFNNDEQENFKPIVDSDINKQIIQVA